MDQSSAPAAGQESAADRIAALEAELSQLRDQFDQFRRAVDAHAIVSMTDAAGNIIYANDKFCEISGYSRDELLGQNHRIIKSGIHPPDLYWEMWHTISNGRIWHGEVCNRHKAGYFYWVYATIVPLFGTDGRPERYISIRTDITPIKNQEKLLRQRDERLRRIQAYAKIGFWEWDLEKNSIYWSDELAALCGLLPEEQETTPDTYFATIHPDDRPQALALIHEIIATNQKHFEMSYRLEWPDGTTPMVIVKGGIQRDETGRPTRLLGVVQPTAASSPTFKCDSG